MRRLKHIRLFESFDLREGFTEADVDSIKSILEGNPDLSEAIVALEEAGYEAEIGSYDAPMPSKMLTVKKEQQRMAVVEKKYASEPDFFVGDLAVSILEAELNEVTATARKQVAIEQTKKVRVTKEFFERIKELQQVSLEYQKMQAVMEEMKAKAKRIKVLEEQLLPDLEKLDQVWLKIDDYLIEVEKIKKHKSERTTYSYKEISEALEALIPVTEKSKKQIEDIRELNKTIHPGGETVTKKVKVTRIGENRILDWAKEAFGKLAGKFTELWSRITNDTNALDVLVDQLEATLPGITGDYYR